MITVKVLNNNSIITLEAPGKLSIKAGESLLFYSAGDLLCASLATCVGKEIVLFGRDEKVDVVSFELIHVHIEEDSLIVTIEYPKSLTEKQEMLLKARVESCEMGQKLSKSFKIEYTLEKSSKEPRKIQESQKGCCG